MVLPGAVAKTKPIHQIVKPQKTPTSGGVKKKQGHVGADKKNM
jgi:hypothetical protein